MFDIVHITLTDDMKTNVARIDQQHTQLLDIASKLINDIGEPESLDSTKELLTFLVNYTKTHFTDEEALQIESDYPAYEHHRQIHQDFIEKASALQSWFEAIHDPVILRRELEYSVISWVTDHILREDTEFARYYRMFLQKETANHEQK